MPWSACTSNQNIQFTWTPQQVGNYTIKVQAWANESYLLNQKKDEVSQHVHVFDSSQQFCYTNIQNFKIIDNDNVYYANENLTVQFKILSGQNNGDGSVSPRNAFYKIYIDGSLSYYGTVQLNSLNYVTVSKTIHLSEGNHIIKIEGRALNCQYSNNQPTTVQKEIYVYPQEQPQPQPQPPQVTLQVNPTQGQAPLQVSINVTVHDSDSQSATIYFDYDGDGNYDSSTNILFGDQQTVTYHTTHTYTQAGTYTLKVKVVDDQNHQVIRTQTITVQPQPQPQPPQVTLNLELSYDDANGNNKIDVGENVTINASVSLSSNSNYNFTLSIYKEGSIVKEVSGQGSGNSSYLISFVPQESGNYTAYFVVNLGGSLHYKQKNFTVYNEESEETEENEEEGEVDVDTDFTSGEEYFEYEENEEINEETTSNNNKETSLLEKYKALIDKSFETEETKYYEEKSKKSTVDVGNEKEVIDLTVATPEKEESTVESVVSSPYTITAISLGLVLLVLLAFLLL